MILSTDMARHTSDLSHLKNKLEDWNIKDGKNLEAIVTCENEAQLFLNQ